MSSPGTNASMGRVVLVSNDSAAIEKVTEGMQHLAIATGVWVDVSMLYAGWMVRNSKLSSWTSGWGRRTKCSTPEFAHPRPIGRL